MKYSIINGYAYVAESYRDVNGKSTTRNIESLGKLDAIKEKYGCDDPVEWVKAYVRAKTAEASAKKEEEERNRCPLPEVGDVSHGERTQFSYGYLYLQRVLYGLKVNVACQYMVRGKSMSSDTLMDSVRTLVYGMVLSNSSHYQSYLWRQKYFDPPKMSYDAMMDSLDILEEKRMYLHKYFLRTLPQVVDLDLETLYLDCTNFYHCMDAPDSDILDKDGNVIEEGFRKYGPGKENRKKPLSGLAAVVEGHGIPILFIPYRGNKNEQLTYPETVDCLHALGLKGFKLCADAGLSSLANRALMAISKTGDTYVTVLPIRKKGDLLEKAWYIDNEGWYWFDEDGKKSGPVDLSTLDPEDEDVKHRVYYKEGSFVRGYIHTKTVTKSGDKVVKETGFSGKYDIPQEELDKFMLNPLPQETTISKTINCENGDVKERNGSIILFLERVVVSFSFASRKREREKRRKYVESAQNVRRPYSPSSKFNRRNRYLKEDYISENGEILKVEAIYPSVDHELISKEESFDGFYAVATNDMKLSLWEISKSNKKRWMDEDLFRQGKSFFEVRPMFVSKVQHIKGHLTVYYIASMIFMVLLYLLNKGRNEGEWFTQYELYETLKSQFLGVHEKDVSYSICNENNYPDLTDALNLFQGIRFDNHSYNNKMIRWLVKQSRSTEPLATK